MMKLKTALSIALALLIFDPVWAQSDQEKLERGEYLADVLVCVECHTPGILSGGERGPDLAGSEVGYEIPFSGIYHGPNLTPDIETGIGTWSEDDIVKAIRTGETPESSQLPCPGGRSPISPMKTRMLWPPISKASNQ